MRLLAFLSLAIAAATAAACTGYEPGFLQKDSESVTPPGWWRYADTGTAFFMSADGVMLTADHVVRRCLRIDVLSEALAPTTASLVAAERKSDLALLRLDGGAAA